MHDQVSSISYNDFWSGIQMGLASIQILAFIS